MQLTELTHDDRLALVALTEALIMADGGVSDSERVEIAKLTDALGEEAFRDLLDEADEKFEDAESLKTYLKKIANRDTQELIFGTAYEEVMNSPSTDHGESALLQWLAEVWNIRVKDAPDQ